MDFGVQSDTIDDGSCWAFFVGAPRCGTTSLAKYLRGHPQACLSRPKEPHFFAMRDLRRASDSELRQILRSEYLDRFFTHRGGSAVLAEGSVSYLYAPERVAPVLRIWPHAKFIICLRNPLQMVPSLHQRHFVNGDETVRQFEQAWALVPERRNGRKVPKSCLDPRFLDYWEAGYHGKHVEKFLDVIGRERCLISIFDDLQADPGAEYRRLLRFIGLPDDGKEVFEHHAQSKDCRIPWLQRLLQRPPKFALSFLDSDDLHNPRFAEEVGPGLRKIINLRSAILDWNEIPAKPRPIDPSVLDEMREVYREDVARLSTVIGRDLTWWIEPEPRAAAADARRRQGIALQG